jgi:cytochrome bd-type quinol oxidase subunit 2
MPTHPFYNLSAARILLVLSLLAFLYFLTGWHLLEDVYRYALTGILFELLWLPMLLCLPVLPLLNILLAIRSTGSTRLLAAVSLLLNTASIIFLVLRP